MKRRLIPCHKCELCRTANTVGLEGHIGQSPKLAIFLDNPNQEEDVRHKFGYSRGARLIFWMLERMSISRDDVMISFTLKCFKNDKQLKTKANRLSAIEACSEYRFALLQRYKPTSIISLGAASCEAFLGGAQQKDKEGTSWKAKEAELNEQRIWIAYSPAYAIKDPSETPGIYRVIWKAAEEAGLKPKTNLAVKLPEDLYE